MGAGACLGCLGGMGTTSMGEMPRVGGTITRLGRLSAKDGDGGCGAIGWGAMIAGSFWTGAGGCGGGAGASTGAGT